MIYVSATPAEYELIQSEGIVVEQVIRPIEQAVWTSTGSPTVEVTWIVLYPGAVSDNLLRVTFWGDEIDGIEEVDPVTGVLWHFYRSPKDFPCHRYKKRKTPRPHPFVRNSEFKGFFPNNAVEYYVSYYDYYQPEAYLPNSDTYIEKDLAINDEIDKLRLAATSALLSGRKDV